MTLKNFICIAPFRDKNAAQRALQQRNYMHQVLHIKENKK